VVDGERARAVLHVIALMVACSPDDRPARPTSVRTQPERLTAPFACDKDQCVERHPRLPDDGEWSCSDVGGAAVCVGGDAAAGIPKNVRDPAWICGLRRVVDAEPSGERVCVDFSPEFPDGSARGWRCRYTTDDGLQRVCQRDPSAHQVGDPCDAGRPCLDGLVCSASRCVPESPAPSCAFDRDCASRACRFGTCQRDDAPRPPMTETPWSARRGGKADRHDDPNERNAPERPWFEIDGDLVDVGFGQPISIDVRPANAQARSGEISWTQVSGPPLSDLEISDRGFHVSARTPRLADLAPVPLPWSIVPLSPRTRGEMVLEAEWHRGRGSAVLRKRVTVTAAARSRGLPNVPVHQRVYLGGSGWRVTQAPPGDGASVDVRSGVSSFLPDRAGTWTLADDANRLLSLQAGRYDDTPLDCGRAGCHRELADRAQGTPMTWALARRLGPTKSGTDETACAIACHATGEPGTHDGGFLDVAAELALPAPFDGVHDIGDLPRPLRRLGSVGCLACHGPGALPEADARWSILRADVCAYCHDAPPRYGHVEGWRASMMSHADHDRTAHDNPKCTGCHTTWGFLERHEREPASPHKHPRKPPEGVGDVGISCAACHDVHGASHDKGLLRDLAMPDILANVPELAHSPSGTCLVCHAPDGQSTLPQASASALIAGRGGVDPRTGAPLLGPAPHLGVTGGCIGCHDGGPTSLERGANHSFAPNPKRCSSCHAKPPQGVSSIATEAQDLWQKLLDRRVVTHTATREEPQPLHATDSLRAGANQPLSRAAKNLALLLEDRAAAVHNPGYSKLLLQTSRDAIERARP